MRRTKKTCPETEIAKRYRETNKIEELRQTMPDINWQPCKPCNGTGQVPCLSCGNRCDPCRSCGKTGVANMGEK